MISICAYNQVNNISFLLISGINKRPLPAEDNNTDSNSGSVCQDRRKRQKEHNVAGPSDSIHEGSESANELDNAAANSSSSSSDEGSESENDLDNIAANRYEDLDEVIAHETVWSFGLETRINKYSNLRQKPKLNVGNIHNMSELDMWCLFSNGKYRQYP